MSLFCLWLDNHIRIWENIRKLSPSNCLFSSLLFTVILLKSWILSLDLLRQCRLSLFTVSSMEMMTMTSHQEIKAFYCSCSHEWLCECDFVIKNGTVWSSQKCVYCNHEGLFMHLWISLNYCQWSYVMIAKKEIEVNCTKDMGTDRRPVRSCDDLWNKFN